jgi:hypothetical protein
MEELFLLAEKIVASLKKTISSEVLANERFSFDESLIKNSSLSITFSNNTNKVLLNLSTHHLDMPWNIVVTIINSEKKINFNNIVQNIKDDEVVYETYPNLLRDPNGLGSKLADEIGNDLLNYLKTLRES